MCDRLEAARASREAIRDRLTAASLARLNAPDPDTFQADARFALDALAALTTRPDQMMHLRQAILNLAVRGKLVQQDPTDEPASDVGLKIKNRSRGQVQESTRSALCAARRLGVEGDRYTRQSSDRRRARDTASDFRNSGSVGYSKERARRVHGLFAHRLGFA